MAVYIERSQFVSPGLAMFRTDWVMNGPVVTQMGLRLFNLIQVRKVILSKPVNANLCLKTLDKVAF